MCTRTPTCVGVHCTIIILWEHKYYNIDYLVAADQCKLEQ